MPDTDHPRIEWDEDRDELQVGELRVSGGLLRGAAEFASERGPWTGLYWLRGDGETIVWGEGERPEDPKEVSDA